MDWLNYHHLYYFWTVAKAGTVSAAAEQLHLTPGRVGDAHGYAKGSGFTRAVATQESINLPLADIQGQVAQGRLGTIVLVQAHEPQRPGRAGRAVNRRGDAGGMT